MFDNVCDCSVFFVSSFTTKADFFVIVGVSKSDTVSGEKSNDGAELLQRFWRNFAKQAFKKKFAVRKAFAILESNEK